jgi:glutathione S-transferase
MKVYGHPMSTCTRKVLTTLIETNTPYELILVDFATGEHKKPAHLARQPFGQVPALEDDGFHMYESRAICRYIDEKARGGLRADDLTGRARVEQWMSVETSNFSGSAMKFIYQHVMQRPQTQEVLDTAQKALDLALETMEKQLSEEPFIAGRKFTLADICFMPYLEYLQASPVKESIAKRPHVSAWWQKISERPSWLKVAGRV